MAQPHMHHFRFPQFRERSGAGWMALVGMKLSEPSSGLAQRSRSSTSSAGSGSLAWRQLVATSVAHLLLIGCLASLWTVVPLTTCPPAETGFEHFGQTHTEVALAFASNATRLDQSLAISLAAKQALRQHPLRLRVGSGKRLGRRGPARLAPAVCLAHGSCALFPRPLWAPPTCKAHDEVTWLLSELVQACHKRRAVPMMPEPQPQPPPSQPWPTSATSTIELLAAFKAAAASVDQLRVPYPALAWAMHASLPSLEEALGIWSPEEAERAREIQFREEALANSKVLMQWESKLESESESELSSTPWTIEHAMLAAHRQEWLESLGCRVVPSMSPDYRPAQPVMSNKGLRVLLFLANAVVASHLPPAKCWNMPHA